MLSFPGTHVRQRWPITYRLNQQITPPHIVSNTFMRNATYPLMFIGTAFGRMAVKKPELTKQNNVKMLQWANANKDWTIERWNKVFSSKNQCSKSFGQIGGYMISKEFLKDLVCLCDTICKVWTMLCYCVGIICQLQIRWFAQGEGLSLYPAESCNPIWNGNCRSRICIHAKHDQKHTRNLPELL